MNIANTKKYGLEDEKGHPYVNKKASFQETSFVKFGKSGLVGLVGV